MCMRTHQQLLPVLCLGLCLAAGSPSSAQPAPDAAGDPGALPLTPALATVGRAELARAYMRLDHAVAAREPGPGDLVAWNRGFDRVTAGFFAGAFGPAVQSLAELTCDVLGLKGEPRQERLLAESVRLMVDPGPGTARIRARSLFVPTIDAAALLRLEARTIDGRTVWDGVVGVEPGQIIDADLSAHALATLPPGTYAIGARAGADFVEHARWLRTPGEPAAMAAALRDRLEAVRAAGDPGEAADVLDSRITLLAGGVDGGSSAALLGDLHALAASINLELAALGRGDNPYRDLRGDWWAGLPVGGATVPCRIYAPPGVRGPAPLVIVLHGAGGDESMFLEAYGGGVMRSLADEHGLIVCSPSTTALLAGPAVFDGIVDLLASWYDLDHDRIYVIGHSMGGGAALGVARSRAGVIAAVAGLAPGGRITADREGRFPPTLIVGAALDPIIPEPRVRAMAQQGIAAGLPVEYRTAPEEGHTLVVGRWLPDVVAWLLRHRLTR